MLHMMLRELEHYSERTHPAEEGKAKPSTQPLPKPRLKRPLPKEEEPE